VSAPAPPRVLFVGRGRYSLPLPGWLAKKWDAIEPELDYRVLGAAEADSAPSDDRFRLGRPLRPRLLDGALFHLLLPFRVRRELREFRPVAIFASDPFVGAAALLGRALARTRTRVIVEVHGDWRTFARLYGVPARRLLAPFADRVAVWAVRRADATRAVSTFTARLVEEVRGRPPSAVFTAFSDLSAFAERPPAALPARPTVIFVAALEAYKNIDGLAAAWRLVAERVLDARLVVVGRGSRRRVVELLLAEFPGRVEHHNWLEPEQVSAALDDATALVLPSWPEGLGRVVIEAFARGRAVVATDAGGIPDLVTDGSEGLLVPPADVPALAAALERVLSDRELAERLGAAARRRYSEWHSTPEKLAAEMRALVDGVVAGTAR
jgi:glycosyltransferase involved in cell wall biosynthesis